MEDLASVSGKDMVWTWVYFSEHLKVTLRDGTLMYSSVTGYKSPRLTEKQVTMIDQFYHSAKMSYVF